MNNKAFTLTELLGVIVILSLLTLISGVAITNMVKKSKTELTNAQKESVLYAAQLWAEDNLNQLTTNGCITKTVLDLKNSGYLTDLITDSVSINICTQISNNRETPILTYTILGG